MPDSIKCAALIRHGNALQCIDPPILLDTPSVQTLPFGLDIVLAYHIRTKHHFRRYAAGPGGLDWASQPDPFRVFGDCPRIELPLATDLSHVLYADLYHPGSIAPQALNMRSLATLLELSFGISAWKEYDGTRWALRCNPSSGNLHPTEAYVVVEACPGIDDGVHHYVSRDHLLEQRCRFTRDASGKPLLPAPGSFLIGLTSIHWREAWKYGERAFRYCQHDVGHAVAAARYAAALLGWRARVLSAWDDASIAAVLGSSRDGDFGDAEREHPDVMLLVTTTSDDASAPAPDVMARAALEGQWTGRANVLSPRHLHEWPIIEDVAQACVKQQSDEPARIASPFPHPARSGCAATAAVLIRQRRSAQALDGYTSMPAATFYRMLDMTLPRPDLPPWDAMPWQPRLHLLLFVHRVDGLAPGLYLFLREPAAEAILRAHLSSEFDWARVEGCPAHFSLFRLVAGDARVAARALSCHQDIAADGTFSLAMLAEYDSSLAEGPWTYRRLFWEAGMLGQVLYLEAEAAGMRGTGIGCYFDDGVHDLLGIQGHAVQSMYHFTIGTPLADTRLQTLPAYAHLKRE